MLYRTMKLELQSCKQRAASLAQRGLAVETIVVALLDHLQKQGPSMDKKLLEALVKHLVPLLKVWPA
jgi:hypothetical protein